jgi:hypothetical protein
LHEANPFRWDTVRPVERGEFKNVGQTRNGGSKRRHAMTDNDVIVIAGAITKEYEEKTGKPRHEENLDNFRVIFEFMTTAKSYARAAGVIFGLPTFVASIIVIVKTIKGH